jgi:hypothetical protein
MNKIGCLVLAGMLAFTLTGCDAPGSNGNGGDASAPPASAQNPGNLTPTTIAEDLDDPVAAEGGMRFAYSTPRY